MKPVSIQIDTDDLAENLQQAETIKQNMIQLLRQLEAKATGKSVETPGSWRHHTSDWAKQNPV